jgi:hypothetical protein
MGRIIDALQQCRFGVAVRFEIAVAQYGAVNRGFLSYNQWLCEAWDLSAGRNFGSS